jgi:probable F420-dependent oxidoreductase
VKIGVVFPHQAIGNEPGLIRTFALTAEELGFRHLLAFDHVLGAEHADRRPPLEGPYTEETSFHEPLTLFAWISALTESLGLVTGVLVLPQRQAALVAKQAAEVQLLSKGRLRLGVGTGWNYVEYESLGFDYRQRGQRLEEQVVIMRQLWTERVVDFTGKFHRIDRAGLRPLLDKPVPIWFGGFSEAQQDRAARLADGFIWSRPSSLAYKGLDRIRRGAAEQGRDPGSLGFDVLIDPSTPDLLSELSRWEAVNGTHATLTVRGSGVELLSSLRGIATSLGSLMD